METKKHAVFLTIHGLGHIIPFAELATVLAGSHNCKVTFLTFPLETNSRQESILTDLVSSGLDIHLLHLTPVDIDDIGKGKKFLTRNSLFMEKAKPSVESALRSIASPVDAFVVDLFCSTMIQVADNLGIPSYMYFTSAISLLALMLSLPKLTDLHREMFNDHDHAVHLDGLPPMQVRDLPTHLQDPADDAFQCFVQYGRRYADFRGIFVNSFEDLEPNPLQVLRAGKFELLPETVSPVYAVGPVIAKEIKSERAACLEWLDTQPERSVLYVSFGSRTTLSKEQVTELALGLKESGQRFLWVLRAQVTKDTGTVYAEAEEILPQGFLEETRSRGLVVPSWAPQMSVLGHPSVGGYMYHGGWNSTLESVWHGVPTIVWPMSAEQGLNRVVVSKEMKCGIGVRMDGEGFVSREEVERCVREVVEGEEGRKARETAKMLMEKARDAVAVGGTSYTALAEGVSMWGVSHDECRDA